MVLSADLKTHVVLDALDMAIVTRKPDNVVHHSDRGSQYTSVAFGARCKEAGVRPSTGSVGDAYDNAMCESFFATLECELIDRRRFRSLSEARMAVFQFHRRLLQSLMPPVGPRLSLAHRIRKEA
jgi:putative transposase